MSNGLVRLCPVTALDAAALYEAARESVEEVGRWLPWCHPEYTKAEAEEWTAAQPLAWDAGEMYTFVIEDQAGRMVGHCGINGISAVHRKGNLGYWIRTARTGCGFATAATRLVARFGLEELKLFRIQVVVAIGNEASRRVAEKAGALYEGLQRNLLVHDGRPIDAHMYCFLPEHLPSLQS